VDRRGRGSRDLRHVDARFQHETFAFGVGFAVLVAAGLLGDLLSSGP
jgi:hypothetical protein